MHFKIDLHGHTFVVKESIFFLEWDHSDSIRKNPEDYFIVFRRGTKAPKEEQTEWAFFNKRPFEEGDEFWMYANLNFYDEFAARAFIKYYNSYIGRNQ